ncbi:endoribonuclease VapD [Riemerella anatipestifer]|uniref:Endoribonuclease VapD 2 n=1 Tax=Riemerella anatipestifer TaxID=34085 RepID=VAPD2_RIEAN|nr:endoribonuclease VapD [Riemerella anatipestifer]O85171.1 RecName: Full=Endoribonuclease VapD 2; AltName: Full=Virulence-associated protein 2 [Riemerella anatipestifer]NHW58374.1 endoribonuclease VapD [Escherichia coli]AAC27553.1 virulence-associated protein 2 [Riemerella anatipestifer]MBT0552609.1 endoribonuclease VapD [Riemerella anatipestifer]MBT0554907.1 endoribonuclease VapD [Riemerella anatipestifer]MCU7543471.1 endoribonuclease VapD [Riemerella anatipestifer]
MYAILFELDTNCLNDNYEGNTYHNSYKLVNDFMIENGFTWKQGSVYFGGANIDAVTCVLVVQKLSKKYPWFSTCVKDVRMLRIEENNDLLPAIS